MHPHEYAKRKEARHPTSALKIAGGASINPLAFGLIKAAYSVNETLTVLSIGRTSLYKLVQLGELTPIKLGRKTLFGSDDLAGLLTKLRGVP
jgi:hypothetical protein